MVPSGVLGFDWSTPIMKFLTAQTCRGLSERNLRFLASRLHQHIWLALRVKQYMTGAVFRTRRRHHAWRLLWIERTGTSSILSQPPKRRPHLPGERNLLFKPSGTPTPSGLLSSGVQLTGTSGTEMAGIRRPNTKSCELKLAHYRCISISLVYSAHTHPV